MFACIRATVLNWVDDFTGLQIFDSQFAEICVAFAVDGLADSIHKWNEDKVFVFCCWIFLCNVYSRYMKLPSTKCECYHLTIVSQSHHRFYVALSAIVSRHATALDSLRMPSQALIFTTSLEQLCSHLKVARWLRTVHTDCCHASSCCWQSLHTSTASQR